ncbi:DUF3352 domain-containing protein [Flaviramulus sp. BrNp1-15]|uniref:DUF3352 domain-containing protein n=1 Tax=Flaviramulus sp. BrNp1-15 TaxID=2916754 RepID=UPI001EE79F26|nr:DUF3352 domain-containing protein [Flaviramulus sp. BrNp1-15]ULC58353.1 DUF3352 domain-containing protein [Flaviramulus sp. BrNp1-15]
MKRKQLLITGIVILIGFLIYLTYIFLIDNNDNIKSIYLIPEDAVYIIESQKPLDDWNAISESDIWSHLNTNSYFNELSVNLNTLDTIFKKEKKLLDYIGNREILISAHIYAPKKYSFFYAIDLQKIAKLNVVKSHLNTFINSNFKVSKRIYHQHEIIEIYSKKTRETLHISFIKNQMILSYVHSLIEAAIDQYKTPKIGRDLNFIEVNKAVSYGNMFRLFFNFKHLKEFSNVFSNENSEYITLFNNSLNWSGFSFDLDENNITANGIANINIDASIYLKALQKSGSSKRTIYNIAPKQTALYTSFTFSDFSDFYSNFETIQKENTEQFRAYLDGTEQVENLLNIKLKDHFFSWIDNEIALLQMHSTVSQSNKDIALILKTNDIDDAKENLDFILNQIKKRSPVKFKAVNYMGHDINYMSIKGFFKIILGNLFKNIEKPYFTIIEDYVVFSNSPNTLKTIIKNYKEKETLAFSEDFEDFNDRFDTRTTMFVYANMPYLYNNLYYFSNNDTKVSLKKNKDYFICFPQVGLQLSPNKDVFKMRLAIDYEDIDLVKSKYKLNSVSSTKNNSITTEKEINNTMNPDVVFTIPEIYPTDLTAKSFTKKNSDGTTKFSVELKDGKPHGKYKSYYKNGSLKLSGKFKKGEQNGIWRAYNFKEESVLKKRF